MSTSRFRRQASQSGLVSCARGLVARRLEGKSRGQALIYVSIMMFTLLAFAALVVDGGMIFMNRRHMQNAVDAAALAGAQQLTQDATDWDKATTGARWVAWDYATKRNGVPEMVVSKAAQGVTGDVLCDPANNTSVDILVCKVAPAHKPNTAVRVTAHKRYKPMIGRVLPGGFKFKEIDIKTDATAMVGSLKGVCAFPIFQAQDTLEAAGAWQPDGEGNFVEYNVPVVMKTSGNNNESGNFMALKVDDPGWNAWSDTVGSPGGCTQVYQSVETQTGAGEGPFDQGLADRQDLWENPANAGFCPETSPTLSADGIAIHPSSGEPLTTANCYRLVQFPMIDGSFADLDGSKPVVIKGFLTFYISNWCGQLSTPAKGEGTADPQHCEAPSGLTDGSGAPIEYLKFGELWGYYLKYEAVTDLPVQAYDGLGTKVIVLID